MASAEREGLSALVRRERISASTRKKRYERKQAESHWNCSFFRHCWNKGLKFPTTNNCLECSEQYWEFTQSQANRRSIHAQNKYHHNNMHRRLKIEVFMIGLGSGLLIKTGLIMKKKVIRKSMFGRKGNGVQEVYQEVRKEECNG